MVTTIQLSESVRNNLDRLKNGRDTYEDVIVELICVFENSARNKEELLIEGCKKMMEDGLAVDEEWSGVDAEFDFEVKSAREYCNLHGLWKS